MRNETDTKSLQLLDWFDEVEPLLGGDLIALQMSAPKLQETRGHKDGFHPESRHLSCQNGGMGYSRFALPMEGQKT